MAKPKTVCVYIEPKLKQEAEARIAELGLSVDEAITIFYQRLASICCDPFSPHIPNAETLATLEQASKGEGLTEYASFAEFLEKLD